MPTVAGPMAGTVGDDQSTALVVAIAVVCSVLVVNLAFHRAVDNFAAEVE